MSGLTIVMYHYVRPIKGSRYPRIKGLELEGFRRQLDYLSKHFSVVTAEDVIAAVKSGAVLPSNSCWLTFDDGYKDHHSYVLPELVKRGLQGSFFAPVKPVTERVMLDVNSIHFILAAADDAQRLVHDLNDACRANEVSSDQVRSLWEAHAVQSRYDSKEVMYVKRMLQFGLPERTRSIITSSLFEKYVGAPQGEFAESLYMSRDEVRELVQAGMYVGSHGFSHLWLSKENRAAQAHEIKSSVQFLDSVGSSVDNWIMCYPYGAYNDDTIELLEEMKCSVGLTTEVAKAELARHHRLKLPRFDTNDFPQ